MTDRALVDIFLDNTQRLIPDHFKTLLGERPSGSQWGDAGMTENVLRSLYWVEVMASDLGSAAQPRCRYFMANIGEQFPNATAGATSIDQLFDDQLEHVRLVKGPHGLGLVLPGGDFVGTDLVAMAYLIVGDHEGHPVVFTVHPGKPLVPLPKDCAVKAITA